MTKKILVIPAVMIIIISFTACGRYAKRENQKTISDFHQYVNQEKNQNINSNNNNNYSPANTEKTNPHKKPEGSKDYNTGTTNTAAIDDLIKTIKDVGSVIDSLDNVSDEDLRVPDPQ